MKYTIQLGLVVVTIIYGVIGIPTISQALNVSWPYYDNYYVGGLSLSQSSVSVAVGQTTSITIYGNDSSYSMFPNSQNIYLAAISGNTLTIIGQGLGSDDLRVCSYNGVSCAVLRITVTNNSNYNNQLSLSQTSLSINIGSSAMISIIGNGSYYVSGNTNSSIASANISGSTLTVIGNSYGNTSFSICQNNWQCVNLSVTVGYSTGYIPPTSTPITFSQSSINLYAGQGASVSIYGGANNYYNVAYNSNTNTIQTSVSGNVLTLTSLSGNSVNVIVVCSSTYSCGAVTVTVNNGSTFDNWTYCSIENQYCSFYGTQTVRYGMNGRYFYKTLTGGTSCSNAVFGDPIFGIAKQCSFGGQY